MAGIRGKKMSPKAWFTGPIAKITFRSVDKCADQNRKWRPYFPTWKEAHEWMLAKADERFKRAQSELRSATMHRTRVKAMQEPVSNLDEKGEA